MKVEGSGVVPKPVAENSESLVPQWNWTRLMLDKVKPGIVFKVNWRRSSTRVLPVKPPLMPCGGGKKEGTSPQLIPPRFWHVLVAAQLLKFPALKTDRPEALIPFTKPRTGANPPRNSQFAPTSEPSQLIRVLPSRLAVLGVSEANEVVPK